MVVTFFLWTALMAIGALTQQQTTQTVTQTAAGGVVTRTTIQTVVTPPAPRPATTHTINVGAVGHKFTPGETTAEVGDVIEWRFYPAEHWVIRGDFDHPCIPYEYVDTNRRGFSSGPQLVNAITDDAPRYRVRVNNTEPIFFYCGAPGSCVTHHMVGVINPTSNMTLAQYLKKAEDVDYQLRPGEPWPTEGETSDPSTTPTPGAPDDGKGQGGPDLSKGEIAGIAIGATGVVALGAAMCYFFGRRRRRRDLFGDGHNGHSRTGSNPTAEPYSGFPRSPMTENWSQKFGFGTQRNSTQRQPSPMPTVINQNSPISPQSTTEAYYYPFPAGTGLVSGNTIVPHHDPRLQPSPRCVAYVPSEGSRQKQQPPVELPTSPQPPASPAHEGRATRDSQFSWKEGPDVI